MTYFDSDFLQFFKDLAANNNRDWFHANKKRYEGSVKNPFKAFITDLIQEVKAIEPNIDMEAKDAIFRINRDIRFSKDKSPYKLHSSAAISAGGRKAMNIPGIYVQIDPEHLSIYSGVYQPGKDDLYAIREHIAANHEKFEQLINDVHFKSSFGSIQGEVNKIIPKEFKTAAQEQPLLYKKNFYYFVEMEPESILKEDVMTVILGHYKNALPLNRFFTEAIQQKSQE